MRKVIWIMGLSGSGKTTIGKALQNLLGVRRIGSIHLDGDELRTIWNDLGFDLKSRCEQAYRAGRLAELVACQGVIAIVSLITPYRQTRRVIFNQLGRKNVLLVLLDPSLKELRRRDTKGLYKAADKRSIQLTGVNDPWEPPSFPDLRINTERFSEGESVAAILRRIKS